MAINRIHLSLKNCSPVVVGEEFVQTRSVVEVPHTHFAESRRCD